MKKTILTLLSLLFILILAACGSTAADEMSASASTGESAVDERTTPLSLQLMLGTVRLEETGSAVDAEQASDLLPLWKALRSLNESGTAAQVEMDALVSQIGDSMTAAQMNAIIALELAMQDFAAVAETLGIEAGGFGGRMGEMTPEMQATREAAQASGEGPGGGQGFGGGIGMDPAARETAMAERGGTRGAGFGINTALLDALIEFLETKVQ